MDRLDILNHLRKINNVSLCEALNENSEESCKGCPLKSDTKIGCLMDDIIRKI